MAYPMQGGYGGYGGYAGQSSNPFVESFLAMQHLKQSQQDAANQQAMQMAQAEAQRNDFELRQLAEKQQNERGLAQEQYLQDSLKQKIAETAANAAATKENRGDIAEGNDATRANVYLRQGGGSYGPAVLMAGADTKTGQALTLEGKQALAA